MPRTPHALMSLLRGRFVGRLLTERRVRIADPGFGTLTHLLRQLGYHTYARLVGPTWAKFHLDEGWDRLIATDAVGRRHGDRVTRSVLELLGSVKSPFFLMIHYADPHAPYAPGSRGSLHERYAEEVRFTDAQVGVVMAELERAGRLEDTLIVVFADHGEDLGDHGGRGGHHGVSLFEEVVHTPLIVVGPGLTPRRVAGGVSLADVAPTLLDLVSGRVTLPDPDGCSLQGPLFGTGSTPAFSISEFYDFGHALRAIEADGHKLIVDARRNVHLLFDVRADPRERTDLADEKPEVAAALRETLDRWVEERSDTDRGPQRRCRP